MPDNDWQEVETEIWAEFCLRGQDLDLDRISTRLSLTPTKSWKRGSPAFRGGGTAVWKDDGWQWGTQHELSLDLPRHIEDIVDLLRPKADFIREYVASGLSASVEGVAKIARGDLPMLLVSNSLLTDIGALGLSLAFDLIYLPLND